MTIKNYINGELRDALSNKIINVVNPSIGKVYGTLPDSDSQDVMLAIEAAKEALPAWKILSFEQRFDLLLLMPA